MDTVRIPNKSLETLEGFDIVCFATAKWMLIHSVCQNTMTLLAKKNRVLYVEPFLSLPTLIRVARSQNRSWQFDAGLRQVASNLWVYTPPPVGLPGAFRCTPIMHLNGWILSRLLVRLIDRIGFRSPLLWTFAYDTLPTVRRLTRQLLIYDCVEEDAALAQSERQRQQVRKFEEALCREADIVFGVTEALAAARRPFNANTFEVPCAGDLDHFGKALNPTTVIPADIAHLPRPGLGYLGGVDPWKMDVALLQTIARTHPSWSIVLVGYVWFGFDPTPLKEFPNIHVLGAKAYEDFPGYLKGMDVCLMPFPLNDITRNGDALKCYEYLAGGKPVVSTPVPAAQRFPGIVKIASTPEAFISAIEDSLREDASAGDRRLAAVQPHSWEHRIAQKSRLIYERLRETRDKARL